MKLGGSGRFWDDDGSLFLSRTYRGFGVRDYGGVDVPSEIGTRDGV